MTDLEQFNLFWLCYAMTAPVAAEERYYFDGLTKLLFEDKQQALFDMVGLPLSDPIAEDLKNRMDAIDAEASQLVEIPRLNVQDKIEVQLLFLSKFPNIIYEEELRLSSEQQQDAYGFVLDTLDKRNADLAPMLPYWDDFKLKTIQYYLEKYTGLIGITLKML